MNWKKKVEANYPGEEGIQLKVRNGFIVLKGVVKNQEVKSALLETIYETPGVREIISELSVRGER